MFNSNFIKGVEKLINPIDVGSLHFMQYFNKFLPKSVQDFLVKSSSRNTPYMGFVVEPYATFLCFEIKDIQKAKSFLPDGFELLETKVFENDTPKFIGILGCFTAHTSAFWGSRIECYLIAKDIKTNLLSWIIVDYDSNTISYDIKDGLRSPNSHGVVTTSYDGNIIVDFKKFDGSRSLVFNANFDSGTKKKLDQRLWLEGNLSIGYGNSFESVNPYIFSLKFNPEEVESAIDIPLNMVTISQNTWFKDIFSEKPFKVVSFPYAQHYISDSPGASSNLKSREELVKSVSDIDFQSIKVLSSDSFKKMFLFGIITSLITTTILILLLVVR